MASSLDKASESMDYKNECYKAIYSVSEYNQSFLNPKGKACAVNTRETQFLVTSRDAVAQSPDADSKEIIVDRFCSKYPDHTKDHRYQVLNIQEKGDLTIIKVEEELKPSLSVLVGEHDQNVTQNFRVFTFSGKECFAVEFIYDSREKMHQMEKKYPIKGDPKETDLIGSPIIVEREGKCRVVGVLGRRNGKLAPIFITGALFGEYHVQC